MPVESRTTEQLDTIDILAELDAAASNAGMRIIPMPNGNQIWVSPESHKKIIDYANAKEIPLDQAVREIIDDQIFPL